MANAQRSNNPVAPTMELKPARGAGGAVEALHSRHDDSPDSRGDVARHRLATVDEVPDVHGEKAAAVHSESLQTLRRRLAVLATEGHVDDGVLGERVEQQQGLGRVL